VLYLFIYLLTAIFLVPLTVFQLLLTALWSNVLGEKQTKYSVLEYFFNSEAH